MLEGNKIKLVNGKVITINTLDAKRLYLNTSNVAFIDKEMDESGEHIHSISLEGKFKITVGDKFPIPVGVLMSVYEVKYMIANDKGLILYSALPTKTSTFLLPILGKNMVYLRYSSYFVNAYIDHTQKFMCLLYRFTGTEQYKDFEKDIMTDPLCVSHLEHDPYHVTYIFKIPDKYKDDIAWFMEGKYSKFSKALKGRIQKFYGKDESRPIMDVINQSKELKQDLEGYLGLRLPNSAELASKPDEKIEIYIPKTLKDE